MDNIDSAAVQEGLPLEFNSIFVETNHHQLVKNETIQMPNLTQQNETGLLDMIPNNIQDQQLQEQQEEIERGSSCGSSTDDQQAPESDEVISSGEETENVTTSVFTNASSPTISDLDVPPQNGPNMPPLGTSSSLADDNPSLSKSEDNESELGQPQNQNLGIMNHAQDDNTGEISSGTAVFNSPNMEPLGTISSGSPAVAGAPQHYPPTLMDYRHPELRSLARRNRSNSSSPNQHPVIQPLSSFQLRSQNRSLGINSPDATDIPRSSSSFFNGHSLPVGTMGMSTAPQESVVLQPFRQEDVHQPNLMYPFYAFSENVPQVLLEQYLPVSRSMGAIGEYGTNNVQPSQIMINNNFMDSNISQQPSLFSNSFPQNTMIGTGVADQNSQLVNPQQAIAMFAPLGMLNAAYNLPNTSAGFWPQYLPNQPQQFGQVPQMANIAFDTNNLEYSSPLWPQNISYFYTNNQPSNIAPAAHDQSLLYNPMLPEVSFNSRPPHFSYPCQQPNGVQPATNTSVMPESNAMSSRISPALDARAQQVNQSPVTLNMTGPREYSKDSVTAINSTATSSGPSSLSRLSNSTNQREPQTLPSVVERLRSSRIPKPSILTRSRARSQQNNDLLSALAANNPDPIESLMRRLAQSTEKGLPKAMSSGTSANGTILPDHSQILNSQTEQNTLNRQQEGGIMNTGVPNIPDQFVTSPMKELGEALYGTGGRTLRAPKRVGIGESMSMLSKRVRRDNQEAVGKESESVATDFVSQPNNNARRIVTNGVYDPKYEDMGLPIDPHLRVLASLNQKKKRNGTNDGWKSDHRVRMNM